MTVMTVPMAPTLSHLAGVELCQTGTWNLSTGPATFTTADFMAAVAALECPAVRRPCLKLGHVASERGQAAIGYIDNLRGDEDWRTLLGDFAGMPGWLATPDEDGHTVIASAFPDRSIEGAWDWRCQMGHTHPFVITAVSLLGAELPGVGTLASLQDVGRLYGIEGTPELVAASAAQDAATTSTVVIQVTATRKDGTMPNPTARTIAATVSADDVRRAFYESPAGSSWDAWIEEIQLDPLQIIYIDDDEGTRYRVPITIGTGDGPDAVTFGLPVQVVIRYEDTTVAASAGTDRIRYASKSESRPGQPPKAAAQTPAEPPVVPSTEHKEADGMSDTLIQGLRERFSLAEDADEATVLAKADELLDQATTPEKVAAGKDDGQEVTILRRELATAQTQIGDLVKGREQDEATKAAEKKRAVFAAAFERGAVHPAEHAERVQDEKDYDEAPTVMERVLAGRATGSKFPVKTTGRSDDPDAASDPAGGDGYWFAGVPTPSKTAVEG